MAAELEIRFTGEDPEQQAAFDNPDAAVAPPRADIEAPPIAPTPPQVEAPPILPPAAPPIIDPAAPESPPVIDPNAPRIERPDDFEMPPLPNVEPPIVADPSGTNRVWSTEELLSEIYDLIDQDLINTLQELTNTLDELNGSGGIRREREPESSDDSEPDSDRPSARGFIENLLKQFDEGVTKAIKSMGMADSKAGKMVRSASQSIRKRGTKAARGARKIGRKLAKTRVGKAAVGIGRAALTRVGMGAAAGAAGGTGAAAAGGAAAGGGVAAAGAGLVAALGPVGIAAAVASAAFIGSALTVKKLSDAVSGLADDLEQLSPAIAIVRAHADAARQMAKLDRAERIGPEVAQLEAARDRIQESMYEIQTKILELLMKGAPTLTMILDAINVSIRTADVAAANTAAAAAWWQGGQTYVDAITRLTKSMEALDEAVKAFNGDTSGPQFMVDPFFKDILNAPGVPAAPPPNIGGIN